MGVHATPGSPPGKRGRSDKEASLVVSWIRQLVVALALVALAFLGVEIALFLLAAAFL